MRDRKAARPSTGGLSLVGVTLAAALLAACAGTPQHDALRSQRPIPEPRELSDVPFYAQDAYQCGPAALAMALNWSGVQVSPDALTPQLYLPGRRGSLAVEMQVATRRHARIAYVLAPRLADLFAEVATGHPVIVFQNLGLAWYPRWHYAVLIGFDVDRDQVVLHSGREARKILPIDLFEHTWRRTGHWAMLVLPPGELPHTAAPHTYLHAVAALERQGYPREAAHAYRTALARWPRNLAAQIGLGNSLYAQRDLPGAERAFRAAIADHPQAAAAHNNLAQVLLEQGRTADAELAAREALRLDDRQSEVYRETLQQILDRRTAQ